MDLAATSAEEHIETYGMTREAVDVWTELDTIACPPFEMDIDADARGDRCGS